MGIQSPVRLLGLSMPAVRELLSGCRISELELHPGILLFGSSYYLY